LPVTYASPTVGETPPPDLRGLPERISLGNRLLIAAVTTPAKREGIAAFVAQDYDKAVEWFELSLKALPNDPETRIYLNNARLRSQNQPPHNIATSVVPIGTNLNVAQEILRGVAQAQDEANRKGGIDGVGLEVTIIDDDNNPAITREMARLLVENNRLMAVVGHNTSDASMAALRRDATRSGLQKALAAPDFATAGAEEEMVRFLDTGDRRLTPVLVQVQPDGANRYRFQHLPTNN